MIVNPRTTLITLCLVGLAEGAAAQGGSGSFLIAPTRLVFEGRVRNAELTLSNTGTAASTYRIGVTYFRMGEAGEMLEIQAPSAEDRPARELIRYSPRQVTLQPGISQTVRVAIRKPEGLAVGEYRAHLTFSPVPKGAETAADDAVGARVQLNVGVSIAVIVRQGELTATTTLDEPRLSPAEPPGSSPALDVTLRRSGDRSVYGRLVATFTPKGGKAIEVGLAKGIGVYAPNPLRRFRLSLNMPTGVILRAGRLDLRYVDEEKGDHVLASTTLLLP